MITVYGAPPSRGIRVIWMLEELGLPYQVHPVNIATRREDADFMALSPAGAIPAFDDGHARITESMAIVEYLAARHGPTPLALVPDEADYPAYLQFLHFGEASLAAPLNVVIASRFFAPEAERENWGAKAAVHMVLARFKVLAARLAGRLYVAGDRFTAADISCAYALHLATSLGLADKLDPGLLAYYDRLRARPAYERAQAHAAPLGVERTG
jgi:glutathione S-transferase